LLRPIGAGALSLQVIRSVIFRTGRLLAPSMPVISSTVMAHPVEDGTDRQVALRHVHFVQHPVLPQRSQVIR
jgi:hypothetical protein